MDPQRSTSQCGPCVARYIWIHRTCSVLVALLLTESPFHTPQACETSANNVTVINSCISTASRSCTSLQVSVFKRFKARHRTMPSS